MEPLSRSGAASRLRYWGGRTYLERLGAKIPTQLGLHMVGESSIYWQEGRYQNHQSSESREPETETQDRMLPNPNPDPNVEGLLPPRRTAKQKLEKYRSSQLKSIRRDFRSYASVELLTSSTGSLSTGSVPLYFSNFLVFVLSSLAWWK